MPENRKPFHREVAEKLIEQIEAGTAPWQRPWVPGRSIMPANPTTGKKYRGINTIILMMAGYDDNRWLTFNQAEKAGYRVKKGEHGTPIQYWVFTEKVNKINAATGEPELDKNGKPVKVEVELEKPKIIISRVFNAQQIDGIPSQERQAFTWDPHQRAEEILNNSGIAIEHSEANTPAYDPRRDVIELPEKDQFPDAERYYNSSLHELTHATGHESRLNRDIKNPFGSEAYAREELVAEIASLMLCAEVGIAPDTARNAAYVNSWVTDLENHPMEIFKAAQQADRAAYYLLDLERERMKERNPAAREAPEAALDASPSLSPRFEVEYFNQWKKATAEAAANPENVHVLEHDGTVLLALKGEERLYSVPNHMPVAGEQFESQTGVRAFDADGGMYNVILSETLQRRDDGGNDVIAERYPVEITPANRSVAFPLDWTGELAVKPCVEDREGNVLSGDLHGQEPEFHGVYAVRSDGTELHVKDFDREEHARNYAEMVGNEYAFQSGRQVGNIEPDREDRQYIKVPYADRDTAKAMGAAWDREEKSWYIPPGVETAPLAAKWPEHDPAVTRAELEAKQAERAARPANRDKVFINVPKAEKEDAKELGARWDRQAVSWYVPAGVNPGPLTDNWPRHDPAAQAKVGQAAPSQRPSREAGNAVRVYLSVPYREKEAAKAAGARWDSTETRWYAAPSADLGKLAKWRSEERVHQEPTVTPREEFAATLREIGARVEGEHPIVDKKPHRIEVDGDKAGERSGFYVMHPDGKPAGYCKNNRTQEEIYFVSKGYVLDADEKKRLQDKALETLARREAEMEKTYNRTADKLQKQLRNLTEPEAPTPYLAAKGVLVHAGIFASGQTTCIPAYNIEGKVRSMQYIQPDGSKRFAKDSRREGCFHPVGGMDGLRKAPAIVIAEGYATAATIKEALGHATVAAFDAGNLIPVAQAMRRAMPDKPIIIAGDDDRHLEAAGKVNVGKAKALEAAEAVGGKAVFPVFAPGERDANPKGFTDFNDLAVKSALGLDAVKSQVGAAVERQIEKRQAAAEQAKTRERGERTKGGKEISRV